jgi:malate dehydrogenase
MKRTTVVAGAAGGIGQVRIVQRLSTHSSAFTYTSSQPLSLLLNTPGVATDLSHISSIAQIEGFLPADDGMKKAFTGADIVVIPAGIPRKPPAIMVASHCKQDQELSIYPQASLA